MGKDDLLRGLGIFGSAYIKRWLEPRYDQLIQQPFMAKLRAANIGTKLSVEAILYALTAFAEQRMADKSPLGLMVKTVLIDAAPEISARLLNDARADLTMAVKDAQEPQKSVASRILALGDTELLSLLVSMEEMDAATRVKFLSFASTASEAELRRFASLAPEQRNSLLGMHSENKGSHAMDSFKSFLKDFWAVVKAGGQKTADISLPLLNRYLLILLQTLKTSAVLWTVALVVCTASTMTGRWSLFALVLGLLGASAGLAYFGKSARKTWLSVAGFVSGAVMGLLALLVASGYPDAVFAVAVFFLVGLPTLAIVTLLIPVTTVGEILRRMFPEGHRTLVRAFQMLLTAFFGVLLFSMILLLFPPRNPVAFLFIVPSVMVLAVAVGFGLSRINPEAFLKTPVILTLGVVMLVTMGVMSMPNLRSTMRKLPAKIDLTLVDAPTPVTFTSSKDIDFVSTKDGEAKIWYAERAGGGYDLFRCEGVGPYYAKDGRVLEKAADDSIRRKIAASVDRETAEKDAALRQAEKERTTQDLQARERRAQEQRLEEQRLVEQKRLEEQRLAEQQRTGQLLAEQKRRASYLLVKNLPGKVDFIVCAATATKVPMDTFSAALVSHLKGRGKTASGAVFSPTFVKEGAFDSFFTGRGGEDLQGMPVPNMGRNLLFARITATVKPGSTAIGLFSASVVVAFSVLSAQDGNVLDGFELKAVGPGTSESDATSAAFNRILDQLGQHNL